ncbi:NAD(+)/NADH kinase [Rhodohalobacter sulfatireducens]|uniref:NAD kinase n=1 Tax=Rhodohalobacter sulfatireducens TaxID=2911366 RepID=A0ABS9KCF5_9BACT|nr:NAD(+)/NADH kinase [Rhodohalobacter sulfatireducens]MCG2588516.1 NAD(+)/NADH kinase [Rhodohalobacter sulfatireducens]MDR9364450.1 NAD(+)/NADH kinase [Balneolaceae bacterium]MDR9407418.1 NAD(+)/NADH kinase [Balneolaceae bacterium]
MSFCIIANPEKYSIQDPLERVILWAQANGTKIFVTEQIKKQFPEIVQGQTITVVDSEQKAIQEADVIIALGGDGTMLHTAHLVKEIEKPLVGINTGKLGFMANIQPSQIEEALQSVVEKKYRLDKRQMLQAKTEEGEQFYALNEFLFSRKDTSSMIKLEVEYDGSLINHYWADGLIISSPTGSTAYNLSAGGPIIQPNTPVMVVTPINPHTLTTRPLVLPSNRPLTVRSVGTSEHILFSYDGIVQPHNSTLDIEIIQSDFSVDLIQLPEQNYFETLRNKLMWGFDKRKD